MDHHFHQRYYVSLQLTPLNTSWWALFRSEVRANCLSSFKWLIQNLYHICLQIPLAVFEPCPAKRSTQSLTFSSSVLTSLLYFVSTNQTPHMGITSSICCITFYEINNQAGRELSGINTMTTINIETDRCCLSGSGSVKLRHIFSLS